MTRTPDDVKKGLECLIREEELDDTCGGCDYLFTHGPCAEHILPDALALIQQLEDHLREATKKVKQLEAERDAAVADLSQCTASHCPYCKHWDRPKSAIVCINCRNGAPRCKQHFEWRGVQKEDGNAQ